jgi:hypothetical protein
MSSDGKFKDYAFRALERHFGNRDEFEKFFDSITEENRRQEFLRVAAFYLFLAKGGDWRLNFSEVCPDYIPNSFKVVAIFSLIESLSDERHLDFYEWLNGQPPGTLFPISDKQALATKYQEYKVTFGSIRRCINFFERLSPVRRETLFRSISEWQEQNQKMAPLGSIEKVAQFLYNLRSEFVHNGKLVLELDEEVHLSKRRGEFVQTKLDINGFMETFEDGLLIHFGYQSR